MTVIYPSVEELQLGTVIPISILIGTIAFNPVLAMINANIQPIGPTPVIVAELALIGTAHLYALANFRTEMRVWYTLILILIALALYRKLGGDGFSIRHLRDAALIPTFILLGITVSRATVICGFLLVHVLVCVVAIFETAQLSLYSDLFDIRSYYVNTRGVEIEEFTTEGSNLYISAMRPEARFFNIVDLHRVSSVFLEPVSLGNYTIIASVLLIAWVNYFRPVIFWLIAISIFALMIASDGRLAFISTLVIIFAAIISPVLPRNLSIIYVPSVVLLNGVLVGYFDLRSGVDDFPGRLAYSAELLNSFQMIDWFGLSSNLIEKAADAGFAYMILSQSIMGSLILWVFIVFGLPERAMAERLMKNGICIYLVLTMTVSFSFLTIKTAALLWFAYGAMLRSPEAEG